MNGKINKAFNRYHADETLVQRTFDDITKRKKKNISGRYKIASIMAMFAVFILGSVYLIPVSYISIDINPSIELSLNAFNVVIKADASNADGEDILNAVSLINLNYVDALETLDLSDVFSDYSDSYTEVTVITNFINNSENMIENIYSSKFSGENISCHSGNNQLKIEAEHNDMSFGKYRAYIELQKIDNTITVDKIHHMSMAEIRQLIEDGSIAEEIYDENIGSHHGNGQGKQHRRK